MYSPVIPQGGHWRQHHPWTGPYKVESKLSDLNYKILSLRTSSPKPLIVHFNLLKLCTPGTRFPLLTSLPNKPTSPPTIFTYHVGDLAELCNFSDHEQDDHIDTPAHNVHQYPVRTHWPLDRLDPYITS